MVSDRKHLSRITMNNTFWVLTHLFVNLFLGNIQQKRKTRFENGTACKTKGNTKLLLLHNLFKRCIALKSKLLQLPGLSHFYHVIFVC